MAQGTEVKKNRGFARLVPRRPLMVQPPLVVNDSQIAGYCFISREKLTRLTAWDPVPERETVNWLGYRRFASMARRGPLWILLPLVEPRDISPKTEQKSRATSLFVISKTQ